MSWLGLLQFPFPYVIPAGEFPDSHWLPGGAVEDAFNSFEMLAAEQIVAHDGFKDLVC